MFEGCFGRLRPIGFNRAVAQALAALDATSLPHATPVRVVEVQRDSALVHDGALAVAQRVLCEQRRCWSGARASTCCG